MFKKAFTLLELVFAIVVIGIISIVLIPNFDKNNSGEAAYQIAEHLRLAQHHAMVEDFTGAGAGAPVPAGANWWRVAFSNATPFCYDITPDGNPANAAIDPLSKQPLSCANRVTDLTQQFGVSGIDFTACNNFRTIGFNNIGEPISANVPLDLDCNITITTDDLETATVTITARTGYIDVTNITVP